MTLLWLKQEGACGVARMMVDRVRAVRRGRYTAALAEPVEAAGPLFPTLPSDQGHLGRPYPPIFYVVFVPDRLPTCRTCRTATDHPIR